MSASLSGADLGNERCRNDRVNAAQRPQGINLTAKVPARGRFSDGLIIHIGDGSLVGGGAMAKVSWGIRKGAQTILTADSTYLICLSV